MKLKIIVDTVQKAGQGSSLTMLASTRVAAKIAVTAGKIVLGVGTQSLVSRAMVLNLGF